LRQVNEESQNLQQPQPQGPDVAKFELHAYYVPQVHVPEKKKGSQNKAVIGEKPPVGGRAVASVMERRSN
jgi:hypothetical protein